MKIRDLINSFLLIAFSALTVLSLIIHALTFLGRDPRELSFYLWWGLQFSSAFALIVALIASGIEDTFFSKRERISPLPPGWSLDKVLVLCFVVFMFYGFFNFAFTGMVLLNGGSTPSIVNGQYVKGSHGFFTPISKQEFMKAMVYEARWNSGHWMGFFLFAITALRGKAKKGD